MSIELQSLPERHHFGKPVRLAFFDLDGTLINSAGEITPASLNAIAALRANGIAVAVATGRPYFGALGVVRKLEIDQPSVFFSGSLIIDPVTNRRLLTEPVETEALKGLVEDARRLKLYTELYTEDDFFVDARHPELAAMHFTYLNAYPKEVRLDGLPGQAPILKAVIITSNAAEEEKLKEILARYTVLSIMVSKGASHPHIKFANVTSPRASRENAFDLLARHFNVNAEEIAAFGDAEADVPFLSRAGYGVALGNAPESVKQAARFVTRSVEEDGVAYAVGRFLQRDR